MNETKRYITIVDGVVTMVRTGKGKNKDEIENNIGELGQIYDGEKFTNPIIEEVKKPKISNKATQSEKLDLIIQLLGGEIIGV